MADIVAAVAESFDVSTQEAESLVFASLEQVEEAE